MTANINNRIYDELAQSWWDENEFLRLLKAMVNPRRVPCFKVEAGTESHCQSPWGAEASEWGDDR